MRAVLTYHSIDDSGSPVSVDVRTFRQHAAWLASGAVRVLPLSDLLALDADARDAVAVTFDDALESFGSIAAPLLLDAGLPVVTFVVSEYTGRRSDWAGTGGAVPAFPTLSWTDLGRLHEAGVELGAHSRTHPALTTLTDERLADEVEGSGRRIREETGAQPRAFSYPYGDHDDRVAAATAACGYTAGVTTDLALLEGGRIDPHRIPRLDMYYFRSPGRLESWGTPAFTAYLAARRIGRTARRLLTGGRL